MSKRKPQQTRAQQQKTTAIVAIGTFIGLSLVALVAWSLTRASEPAPIAPAAAIAAPQAAPSGGETFERITLDEAKKLVDTGRAVFLDVRSMEQYKASHITGAMQIPVPLVQGEIPYLPKDKLIITYCTCPAEESSGEATMILTRGGLQSKALHGGFNAWVDAGYPSETGA
ncbi:MAG: rhodanese-like domain-containing protein [Thermoanaerobaculia bacterium]